jgi:hypothetical protein
MKLDTARHALIARNQSADRGSVDHGRIVALGCIALCLLLATASCFATRHPAGDQRAFAGAWTAPWTSSHPAKLRLASVAPRL